MGRPASRAISGSSGVYPYAKPAGSLANRPLASWSMPSPAGSMDANPTSPGSTNIPSLSRPCERIRLFFILTYLKTYALQVVQGRLFGMRQSKANQWAHVLLPALLAALRTLSDAPTRSLTALAQRLGVTQADAATVVVPLE